MRRDDILVREYRHPLNGRVYQLSGKLVDWGDRPAHIEYVRDVTEQRRSRSAPTGCRRG